MFIGKIRDIKAKLAQSRISLSGTLLEYSRRPCRCSFLPELPFATILLVATSALQRLMAGAILAPLSAFPAPNRQLRPFCVIAFSARPTSKRQY